MSYRTVTTLEWRCCPGFTGSNCEEGEFSSNASVLMEQQGWTGCLKLGFVPCIAYSSETQEQITCSLHSSLLSECHTQALKGDLGKQIILHAANRPEQGGGKEIKKRESRMTFLEICSCLASLLCSENMFFPFHVLSSPCLCYHHQLLCPIKADPWMAASESFMPVRSGYK